MKTYGLIGYPLGHSFSQSYFTEKFKREGLLDCTYRNFPLSAIEKLPELLRQESGLRGLNVTIPYKQQVLSFLDFSQDVVLKTGACNCIRIDQDQLSGFNTDVLGFEQSLTRKLKSGHNQALILGTGGSSQAVQYVLQKLGIPFALVSRQEQGDGSVQVFSYQALSREILAAYPLIINTTPVGMYPHIEACPPLPYEGLTPHHYLFDLIYNPAMTTFLQWGVRQGAQIQNGYDMLSIQAEASWTIWNG